MPRHKKKKRAANAAAGSVKRTDWLVGDLVVVKLRGHRPWPAQIQKPEDYGYDARPHRIFVTFYGTEETCFCSYNKITPFTSATRKTLAEQLQKVNTNPELEKAIKEIFAADDDLKKSRNSRHKEDETIPEKSEGGVSPVERTRKRGRAVEEECTADIVEDRTAKQEKTVKKMAAEQVHKLPRKVRIKVSSQRSDSPRNQQADSLALPGPEKASVSSSEVPSREVSPHRASDSNDRAEVSDAPGKKDVRGKSVHDAVELADASDKKNARATSGQKSDLVLKDDAATMATKVVTKHGVQNGDDANDQMDTDEDSLRKEPVVVREDVEKMDVDDQKVEDLKVTGESGGDGKESDSVDHGVQGSNVEDPKKKSSSVTEQHHSDHADIPVSATVNLCGQSMVKDDSNSSKSMDSGNRDVSGGRSEVEGDKEQDHQTPLEFVSKDANAGSVVPTKVLQPAATTPQGEAAGVKQDGGTNVARSVSVQQVASVPTSGDDAKEQQIFEPPVLEKPVTASASTTTSREADSKDSASVQASDSSSRPNGVLLSGKDSVKTSTIQDEVMQKGQDLAPNTKNEAIVEVSAEDQNPSSTTQGITGQPPVKAQVPTAAKQDQDVQGDVVVSNQHLTSATTSVLPAILPRETISEQIPGYSEERLGSDHQTSTLEKENRAGERLVASHASGDDSIKIQVLDGDTHMTEAGDDESVKSQSTDLTQRGADDAVKLQSTNTAQGRDDPVTVKEQSTILAGGDGDVEYTESTETTQVPGGDGLKSQQTSMPQALTDHEVKTQSTDTPQGVEGNTSSTQSTNRTQAVSADSAKSQSTDKDSGKTQSTGTDSAKTQSTDKDSGKIQLTGTDSAKTQSTDKDSGKTQSTGLDSAKTQSTEKDSAKMQSTEKASAKMQSTDSGQTRTGTDSAKTQVTEKDLAKAQAQAQPTDKDSGKTQSTDMESAKTRSTDTDSAKTLSLGKNSMTTEPKGEACVVKDAVREDGKVEPSRADDLTLKHGATKHGVDVSDRDVSVEKATTEGEKVIVSCKKVAPTDGERASIETLQEALTKTVEVPSSSLKGVADEERIVASPVKDSGTNKEEVLVAPVKGTGTDVEKVTVPPGKDARVDDEKAPVSTMQEATIADEKILASPVKEATVDEKKVAAASVKEATVGDENVAALTTKEGTTQ